MISLQRRAASRGLLLAVLGGCGWLKTEEKVEQTTPLTPEVAAPPAPEVVAPPAPAAPASSPFPAVLLSPEILLYAAPPEGGKDADAATAIATLHGPVEVGVLEERPREGTYETWMRVSVSGGPEGWVLGHGAQMVLGFTLAELRDLTKGGAPFPLFTGIYADPDDALPYVLLNGFAEVTAAGLVDRPEGLSGTPAEWTPDSEQRRWLASYYKPGATYTLHRPGGVRETLTVGPPVEPGCIAFSVEAMIEPRPQGEGQAGEGQAGEGQAGEGQAGQAQRWAGSALVTAEAQARLVPAFRELTPNELALAVEAARGALSPAEVQLLSMSSKPVPELHGGFAYDPDADGVMDLVASVSFQLRGEEQGDPTMVDLIVALPASPAGAASTVLVQNRGFEEGRSLSLPVAPFDIDADGTPEIIVVEYGYEWSSTAILRRTSAGWKRAWMGGSEGC